PFTAPNNVHNTNLDLTNKITNISGGNYEKTVAVGEPVTTVTDNPATPDVTGLARSHRYCAGFKTSAVPVGAGLPAITGTAGARHRVACFAGLPAPTGTVLNVVPHYQADS
ncbi:hypothetical protein V0R58_26550, partial [Pseudomonas inefficax]|nr:hypothetical protein [Pseudomonas inefficax]